MKKSFIMLAATALLSITACSNEGRKADGMATPEVATTTATTDDPLEAFAEHFSQTASFAYANVGGHRALLVSHETFGNNANEDVQAIAASIFVLDAEGKVMTLGSVRSQGTLYPVSVLDGQLLVAGHQFVKVYGIRGEVPELVLDAYQEGDGPELKEWYETFEKGEPVKFRKTLREE